MTRYEGNTGRFVHVLDPVPSLPVSIPKPRIQEAPQSGPQPSPVPEQAGRGQPAAGEGGGSGILDGLGKIFSKITKPSFETEDLILVGIFYLLYRESGDIEFLLMAGAILFL